MLLQPHLNIIAYLNSQPVQKLPIIGPADY